MEFFISNLENSLKADIPLLSIVGAFTLIDAMTALDTPEGHTDSRNKFLFCAWIKKYLPNYITMGITPEDYYTLRCALFHQMSGARTNQTIQTLLFTPGKSNFTGHFNLINSAFHLDVHTFVTDVINAAKACILNSQHYPTHQDSVISLHKNGLAPFIEGIPVIASKSQAKTKKTNQQSSNNLVKNNSNQNTPTAVTIAEKHEFDNPSAV